MIDRVVALCMAGCAVFAALLFVELGTGEAVRPPVVSAPQPAEARPERRRQPPHADEVVSSVLDRPLFSETRRPAKQAKTDGTTTSGLRDKRLTGIVIDPQRRLAIFAVTGAKPLVRSEGEMVDEWRLDFIAPREVLLSGPDGTTTLMPKGDPNRPAPAPRPAVNPPDGAPPEVAGLPAAAATRQPKPAVRVLTPPDPDSDPTTPAFQQ